MEYPEGSFGAKRRRLRNHLGEIARHGSWLTRRRARRALKHLDELELKLAEERDRRLEPVWLAAAQTEIVKRNATTHMSVDDKPSEDLARWRAALEERGSVALSLAAARAWETVREVAEGQADTLTQLGFMADHHDVDGLRRVAAQAQREAWRSRKDSR